MFVGCLGEQGVHLSQRAVERLTSKFLGLAAGPPAAGCAQQSHSVGSVLTFPVLSATRHNMLAFLQGSRSA